MAGFAVAFKNAVVIIVFEVAVDARAASVGELLGSVTIVAFDVRVLAEQREAHQVVIKVRRVQPFGLAMTITALLAELPFMRVILKMTSGTVRAGCCIEDRFYMTVIAGNGLMRSVQREIRRPVVVERRQRPCFTRVAGTTVSATMSVMAVIFQVAAGAGHIHYVIERVFVVTIGTEQCCVFALERKVSIAGMVKTRVEPVAGVVAVLTLFAAAPVVRIVLGMTAETVGRRILVGLVGVAIGAFCFDMLADQ